MKVVLWKILDFMTAEYIRQIVGILPSDSPYFQSGFSGQLHPSDISSPVDRLRRFVGLERYSQDSQARLALRRWWHCDDNLLSAQSADIDLTDLDRGIEFTRRRLRELGAPPHGSVLVFRIGDQKMTVEIT